MDGSKPFKLLRTRNTDYPYHLHPCTRACHDSLMPTFSCCMPAYRRRHDVLPPSSVLSCSAPSNGNGANCISSDWHDMVAALRACVLRAIHQNSEELAVHLGLASWWEKTDTGKLISAGLKWVATGFPREPEEERSKHDWGSHARSYLRMAMVWFQVGYLWISCLTGLGSGLLIVLDNCI